jgi:4-hydroxythreonine-4-phosphate dehydrogenase
MSNSQNPDSWQLPFFDPTKPVLLTQGDPHGIGPEIILKCLSLKIESPIIIIGSPEVFQYYASRYNIELNFTPYSQDVNNTELLTTSQKGSEYTKPQFTLRMLSSSSFPNSLDVGFYFYPIPYHYEIKPGNLSDRAGMHSLSCLDYAINLLKENKSSCLITAPINKQAIQKHNPNFIGHTEYLANSFHYESDQVTMSFISDPLKVFLVTTHVGIRQLPDKLSDDILIRTIHHATKMIHSCKDSRPLALMSLNPHAGEGGAFGDEEKTRFVPLVQKMKVSGISIEGPFSNDALWRDYHKQDYSGYVALYHDSGLIPIKMVTQGKCANVTLGLPCWRLSVDHGTGYDIVNKGMANPESLKYILTHLSKLIPN